ncbi:hypothetical protein BH10CYA1_BH10CYA1_22500 [soil metagenome]
MQEFERHLQILSESGNYAHFTSQTNKVAVDLMFEGKMNEALALTTQSIPIIKAAFENTNSTNASVMETKQNKLFCTLLVSALHTHAWILEELRRFDDAEPFMREALALMESKFGLDSFESTSLLSGLGRLLTRRGRFVEAEPALVRSLTIRQTEQSRQLEISSAQEELSNLYCAMGRLDESEILCSAAYTTGLKLFEKENPELFAGYALCRARLWAAQGKHEEAVVLLNQSITDTELTYGHLHPSHLDALALLQKCLQATNQEAEAEKVDVRIGKICSQWALERP